MKNSRCLLGVALLAVTTALAAVSCEGEYEPDDPRAAFLSFREALLTGDTTTVWGFLTPGAQQVYDQAYNDLLVMQEAISLLDEADQRIVRERTGIGLLASATSGEELFRVLTHLQYLINDDTYRQGSAIAGYVPTPDGSGAAVETESGQTFYLEHDEAGDWRIRGVSLRDENDEWRESSLEAIALERLQPIAENVMAVELMAAEAASSQRSRAEIERILSGQR